MTKTEKTLQEWNQRLANARAKRTALVARRKELVAACVSDPSKRGELGKVDAEIRDVDTDIEIAIAGEADASAANAQAIRERTRDELAAVEREGDFDRLLQRLKETYFDWIIEQDREAARRWHEAMSIIDEQTNRAERAKSLATAIGDRSRIRNVDGDTLRIATSIAIANDRARERRQVHTDVLFGGIESSERWTNGVKHAHPLLRQGYHLEEYSNAQALLSRLR